MKRELLTLIAGATALLGCTGQTGHAGPIVEPLPAAPGSLVPLGKAVEVGGLAVEPLRVLEDSRCPQDTVCVWQGRLVLEVNIAGFGWAEIAKLELDRPHVTHGTTVTLTSGSPEPRAGQELAPADYRFAFQGGE